MKKLKCLDPEAFSEGLSHNFLREISVLNILKVGSNIGHKNIVTLVDFYFEVKK